MNWLDIVLLIILGLSLFASFRKGLSREVIGLVAVVLALVSGLWFYGAAGSFLIPYLSSRSLANFAGFFLVFCGVLLIGSMTSHVVGRFLKVTGLSIVDHVLGTVFGAVRGVLISVALIMGIMAFSRSDGPPSSVVHSRLAPYVLDAARMFAAMAPHEMKDDFHRRYEQVKVAWGQALEKGIHVPKAEKEKNEKPI